MAKRKKDIETLPDSVEAHIAKLPESYHDHPLAWACRQLALDITVCPPDKTASMVRELRLTLAALDDLAPKVEGDAVDEVSKRREERRRRAGLPA